MRIAAALVCSVACGSLAQNSSTPSPTLDHATISTNSILQAAPSAEPTGYALLPKPVPDPIEPVNRVVWAFNQGVLRGVVKPTARVYRFVVRKPLRTGISNFGRNLTYPGRLMNNLLEAKWAGARDETYRFLCNTVLGVGGFFDLASDLKIPKSDADFGQTLGQWGWRPRAYLMLPIYGPSNERDTAGLAVDTAANPLTYLTPYPWEADDPLTYFSPYNYANYSVMYNNLTDSVDGFVRFTRTEMDPYSELEYAWGYVRSQQVVDYSPKGPPEATPLETLESATFSFKNPKFPNRGQTKQLLIPATGRKLNYSFWLQAKGAPLVYIVPGLGSHRLSSGVLALAELLYDYGFSVVTVSSPFNYEFMEEASTAAVPGYAPVDAHDLHVALTEIDRHLKGQYPVSITSRGLMGYSMGAFQTLFIAANPVPSDAQLVQFDRYLAVDTPVRLLYAISKLDDFYRAPLAWPADERMRNIENTFLKVTSANTNSLAATQPALPFSGIEAKFLIGVTFRLILRDAIYSSQARNNLGVLHHPIRKLRREPVYREILDYSYGDYFDKFVVPYYSQRGVDLRAPKALDEASDLRTYAASLQSNPDVRVIVNRNDFLFAPPDLDWLQSTFDTNRLTVFDHGGHLGNLGHPDVQQAILHAFDGLRHDEEPSGTNAR